MMSKLPKKAREWLAKDLDDNDRRRMGMIRWRDVDGKYFSYFDTKEEAFKFLAWQAHRYKHSPVGTTTITSICEESQDMGINLYPTQVGRWFKKVFGITIKDQPTGASDERKIKTFYLEEDVADMFERLGDKAEFGMLSRFYNTMCRFIGALPFDGMVVIFDETPVIFMEFKGEYRSIVFKELPKAHKNYIEGLLYDIKENGIAYAKQKALTNGFTAITR